MQVFISQTQLRMAEALTSPLASNANQSPVPVGSSPMDLHFQRPTPRVKRLQATYTAFCNKSVEKAVGSDLDGANWAKAELTQVSVKVRALSK